MTATSGPTGTRSFSSAALQSSLASRLAAHLAETGSTMYSLTWKTLALPSGRPICQLRAWGRPISVNVSGSGQLTVSGWPTTTVMDGAGSARHGYMDDGRPRSATKQLREKLTGNSGTTLFDAARMATRLDAARMAGWPTTSATDGGRERREDETRGHRLDVVAQTTGRATPQAHDAKGEFSALASASRSLGREATLTGWASPVATELGNTVDNYAAMKRNMRSGSRTAFTHPSLQAQLTASVPPADTGPAPSGSTAATASTGRLNPALSLWLMGLPSAYLMAAPRFARSRGRKSSAR